jgi:hypothetical protein
MTYLREFQDPPVGLGRPWQDPWDFKGGVNNKNCRKSNPKKSQFSVA